MFTQRGNVFSIVRIVKSDLRVSTEPCRWHTSWQIVKNQLYAVATNLRIVPVTYDLVMRSMVYVCVFSKYTFVLSSFFCILAYMCHDWRFLFQSLSCEGATKIRKTWVQDHLRIQVPLFGTASTFSSSTVPKATRKAEKFMLWCSVFLNHESHARTR